MNKIFDIRTIRSIINGSVSGSRKLLLFLLAAIVAWGAGGYFSALASRSDQTLALQQNRLSTLNELAAQYRQLAGESGAVARTDAGDIVPVFSQIVEEMGLRDRLLQISPVSRGVSVQMDRLYAEELVSLLKGLTSRGIRVNSSELRALPFQDKRLFSLFAMLGVEE